MKGIALDWNVLFSLREAPVVIGKKESIETQVLFQFRLPTLSASAVLWGQLDLGFYMCKRTIENIYDPYIYHQVWAEALLRAPSRHYYLSEPPLKSYCSTLTKTMTKQFQKAFATLENSFSQKPFPLLWKFNFRRFFTEFHHGLIFTIFLQKCTILGYDNRPKSIEFEITAISQDVSKFWIFEFPAICYVHAHQLTSARSLLRIVFIFSVATVEKTFCNSSRYQINRSPIWSRKKWSWVPTSNRSDTLMASTNVCHCNFNTIWLF